ncbi:MAG: preprotein translocase subunit SecF [Sulfurovum sp. PC08-66]|nr:MAG: preprotein translocase subunit SecF [Sulfurovum sp. PC08-66]KIM12489.1 MAG: preprotein translocase subunit SecF [Sulfuricurvum sp. PC08-66]
MGLFSYNKTYGFMRLSKPFLLLSLFLVIASWVLVGTKGANWGIDFAGGTLIQVKYDQAAPIAQMRDKLSTEPLFAGSSISEYGSVQEVVIRVKTSSTSVTQDLGDMTRTLLAGTGNFEIRRVDMVGPKVGAELREKGLIALALAIAGILAYVSYRYEWRFALASVLALAHDISITAGMLVLFSVDINLDILAALLTILGYSINDTIIVFDRIREGITTTKESDLEASIDASVSRTLSRTTLTSLTTFFVVLTLYMFGGEIINGFAFTLLVGIIVGTYSSIYVASPLLVHLGFSIAHYRGRLAAVEQKAKEKARIRAQFENGSL